MSEQNNFEPKHRPKLEALDNLSLGISMVVALLIGVAIGIGLKNLTGYTWTLWIGVALGVAAAILNVYKVYKKASKSFDELENDPRYAHRAKYGDNNFNDDDD
jgi:F0F1-type ATP synthase assembly protein I